MTLRRIEEAISRLEAAAQQPTSTHSPSFAQIQESNARLREAVANSLHQIDALLARHGLEPQP